MFYVSHPNFRILYTQTLETSVLQQEVLFPSKCRGQILAAWKHQHRMKHPSPRNVATISLVITDKVCSILNKQLGISSCQTAPFGAREHSPLPPHPVYHCSPKTATLNLMILSYWRKPGKPRQDNQSAQLISTSQARNPSSWHSLHPCNTTLVLDFLLSKQMNRIE